MGRRFVTSCRGDFPDALGLLPTPPIRGVGQYAPTALLAPLLLLAACAATPEAPAPAEDVEPRPPVEARAAVDRAVATTGDVITYTVAVDADEGYEVDVPEPGADIAGFRILNAHREPERRSGGRVIEERRYELRADLVGSYVLPPIVVTYRAKAPAGHEPGDGGAPETAGSAETIETSAIFVEVESVLAAAEAEGQAVTDIRDIKPLQPKVSRLPWGRLGGAAAVLLAALLGAWFFRRRRGELREPPVPPHERAFEALRALRGTDFADPRAVHRFHFEISEVLRTYVEGRFGLNATDLTREEIIPRLPEVPDLPPAAAASLSRFLAATDRVKFADHQPSEAEIEETWERALGFVEQTRPRKEEEGEEEGSKPGVGADEPGEEEAA